MDMVSCGFFSLKNPPVLGAEYVALAVAMVCEQNVNQLKFSTNTNT